MGGDLRIVFLFERQKGFSWCPWMSLAERRHPSVSYFLEMRPAQALNVLQVPTNALRKNLLVLESGRDGPALFFDPRLAELNFACENNKESHLPLG